MKYTFPSDGLIESTISMAIAPSKEVEVKDLKFEISLFVTLLRLKAALLSRNEVFLMLLSLRRMSSNTTE